MSFRLANDDDERETLRLVSAAERRYQNTLNQHPDCRDPDHPGCADCDEDFADTEGGSCD